MRFNGETSIKGGNPLVFSHRPLSVFYSPSLTLLLLARSVLLFSTPPLPHTSLPPFSLSLFLPLFLNQPPSPLSPSLSLARTLHTACDTFTHTRVIPPAETHSHIPTMPSLADQKSYSSRSLEKLFRGPVTQQMIGRSSVLPPSLPTHLQHASKPLPTSTFCKRQQPCPKSPAATGYPDQWLLRPAKRILPKAVPQLPASVGRNSKRSEESHFNTAFCSFFDFATMPPALS